MAQKKAHEVDAWLARPDSQSFLVLLYGPDRGLVAERGKAFAERTGLPLDDPFSVVKLDGGEVEKGEGRLSQEARTVPMFADRRLLWVRNASGQKAFADEVKGLLSEPPRDAIILIEAGELKKNAPLRTVVEAGKGAMALPCYADGGRDIEAVIDDELRKAQMSMGSEARQALRRNLGGDRLATRAELQKLMLYAQGQPEISIEDVLLMTGDVSGQSLDDAVDAILEGRVSDFDSAFTRHCQAGSPPFLALSGTMRQFHALHAMRGAMEEEGRNAVSVISGARPPIFFSRRKLVERALERWNRHSIERALLRLHMAVLQTRRRPELGTALVRQALLGIAIESARLSQR